MADAATTTGGSTSEDASQSSIGSTSTGRDETGTDTATGGDATTAGGGTSDTGSGTDSGTVPRPEDCEPLVFHSVSHPALTGATCIGLVGESDALTTQAEIDAHAAAYCDVCVAPNECPQAPNLPPNAMMLYAYTGTPQHGPDMEITSIEDCGDSIVLRSVVTMTHELALSNAWASAWIPASDKPVEFDIELIFPQ